MQFCALYTGCCVQHAWCYGNKGLGRELGAVGIFGNSFTCRVLRLLSSVWIQARRVNSVMKIWAALANSTGASALIICQKKIILDFTT